MAEIVADERLAPKTVNNALTLLSVAFNQAHEEGQITANPCRRVRRLPVHVPEMGLPARARLPTLSGRRELRSCADPLYGRPLSVTPETGWAVPQAGVALHGEHMRQLAVRLALLACIIATAIAGGAAGALAQGSSCGNFASVGNATLDVGQVGSYDLFAGDGSFTATMHWGDGSSSSASLGPAAPRATLTHAYGAPGSYVVTLDVRGRLADDTPCSNHVFIANATVQPPPPAPATPPTPTTPPATTPPPVPVSPEGLPIGPLPTTPPFVAPGQQPCPPACGSKMPIGGYSPTSAAPATPAEPFTTKTWRDQFNKIKSRQRKSLSQMDKAGTAMGAVCTTVGIPAALGSGPEPTTKIALIGCAALVAAMKGGAALGDLWFDFVDPFDPDYGVVAEPPATPGPHVSSPPVSRRRARALNALSDNFVRARDVLLALMTAINRAQSAAQQGDAATRAAQLQAASRFAGEMGSLVAQRPALRLRVARALKGIGALSPGRVRKAGRTVRRKGLPPDVAATFDSYGVPEAWVSGPLEKAVIGVRGRVDLRDLLLAPNLAKLDRQLAGSFRSLASSFR